MELVIIKRGCSEWDYMWNWLASHPMNQSLPEPAVCQNQNEAWEYMGTYRKSNGEAVHEFRHLNHPVTDNIMTLVVRASELVSDEMIEKRSKIS